MSDISDRIARLSPEKLQLLANRITEKRRSVSNTQTISRRSDPGNRAPASYDQQRLWFLDQLDPGSSAYNISAAIQLSGPLNKRALEQSLNAIVARHEILRTTFAEVDGEPVQIIASDVKLSMPLIDLSELPEARRNSEAIKFAKEEPRRPFDLTRRPLLRAVLIRLSAQEHMVVYTMHHIISDGWSCRIFNNEIAMLYEAFNSGRPAALEELPIQFADYAAWQREWLRGEMLGGHLDYWRQQLSAAPPLLDLRTDRPRPDLQTFQGTFENIKISKSLSEQLREFSKSKKLTLFTTLLTVYNLLLYYRSGQQDIVVGSPFASRNRPETEGLIGLFINTVALRTDLSGDPSLEETLDRVKRVAVEAYAHRELPLEMLVRAIQPERNFRHTPIFQVTFTLQTAQMTTTPQFHGLRLSQLYIHSGMVQFDLIMNLTDTDQGLVGALEYSTELFDISTIRRMLKHFEILLGSVVTRPQWKLSEIAPLLAQADLEQQLMDESDLERARREKLKSGRRRRVAEV